MSGRGGAAVFDPLPIVRAQLATAPGEVVYEGEAPLPLVQADPAALRTWLGEALRSPPSSPVPARVRAFPERHELVIRVEHAGERGELRLPLAVLEPPAGLI